MNKFLTITVFCFISINPISQTSNQRSSLIERRKQLIAQQTAFFSNFPNYYFVETGTGGGGFGVQAAIQANFKEIHSIEIDEKVLAQYKTIQKFAQYKHVKIWPGDSKKILGQVIAPMDKPITFWLDAHTKPLLQSDHKNTPLLDELEYIKQHPIKTHTILIDDVNCCETAGFDFLSLEAIIKKIKSINEHYNISYAKSFWDSTILIAQIKQ